MSLVLRSVIFFIELLPQLKVRHDTLIEVLKDIHIHIPENAANDEVPITIIKTKATSTLCYLMCNDERLVAFHKQNNQL